MLAKLFVSVKCSPQPLLGNEEVGAEVPITFGRCQLPVSDRTGQVLLLFRKRQV